MGKLTKAIEEQSAAKVERAEKEAQEAMDQKEKEDNANKLLKAQLKQQHKKDHEALDKVEQEKETIRLKLAATQIKVADEAHDIKILKHDVHVAKEEIRQTKQANEQLREKAAKVARFALATEARVDEAHSGHRPGAASVESELKTDADYIMQLAQRRSGSTSSSSGHSIVQRFKDDHVIEKATHQKG